jgi:hypothetical protein
MKNSDSLRNPRSLIIICVALLILAALPLLSSARSISTSVNIVNNSNRAIRNVYLSHVDRDDWSGNQLSAGQTIGPGQSFTLNNVVCDQQQVKVIAEDQDGCFLSTAVTCGDNATWTITNDTARDCGSGGEN